MRRLVFCLIAACVVAVSAPSVAPAKSGQGVTCVLHAKLSAQAAGTTSAAKGHTLIKVRNNGTIEFKTHINNRNREMFFAGHIHLASTGSIVVPLFEVATPTSARHIKHR